MKYLFLVLVAVTFIGCDWEDPQYDVTMYITYNNGDKDILKRVDIGFSHSYHLEDGCIKHYCNGKRGSVRCGVRAFSYTSYQIVKKDLVVQN